MKLVRLYQVEDGMIAGSDRGIPYWIKREILTYAAPAFEGSMTVITVPDETQSIHIPILPELTAEILLSSCDEPMCDVDIVHLSLHDLCGYQFMAGYGPRSDAWVVWSKATKLPQTQGGHDR